MEETERRKKLLKEIEEYKKRKEQERKEHPERFIPKWPYELFGIECREGWKHLYQPLIDYVEEYNKTHEEKMEIHQIKEKFGGLRFYVNFYDDKLHDMIRDAEEKSFNTCEICGKHINKQIVEHHWIYAMCRECYDGMKEKQEIAMEEIAKKIKKKRTMKSENG